LHLKADGTDMVVYIGCPTRYRTQHFFNNRLAGWQTAAPCCNN